MDKDAFIELIAEILEVDSDQVTFEGSLDDLDWDSLANINFIAEVDSKLHLTLDANRLAQSEKVSDLYELITEGK